MRRPRPLFPCYTHTKAFGEGHLSLSRIAVLAIHRCYPQWQHDQGFTSRKTVERSWLSMSNFWCWYATEQRGLSCPVTSVNGPQFSHSFWILAPHLQRSACIDRYFILWLHFAKPCCRSSFLLLRCLFHFARSDIRVRRKRCGKMTGLSA